MTLKNKSLSAFSWTKIALYATVFFPGFASAVDGANVPSNQEIYNEVLPSSSPGYVKQHKHYQSISPEELREQICRLQEAWTKARDGLDRGNNPADIYKALKAISTAPEVQRLAHTALMYRALLELAQNELNLKEQTFTPANADYKEDHEL